ncbi:MAG: hypothetical protein INQ03_11330 [Candidatus Heimdallarchaeota archaeon]|nr:hypothetical protein [Candidatus Heimdallarchaeota archaeon]
MEQDKINKLKEFLDSADDWAKLEAGNGVYVIKMPGKGRFKTKLGIEIVPINDEGKPTKKKGLLITSAEQLNSFISIFSDATLPVLMENLENINETIEQKPKTSGKVVGKL